jgi:hypothetical protein
MLRTRASQAAAVITLTLSCALLAPAATALTTGGVHTGATAATTTAPAPAGPDDMGWQ